MRLSALGSISTSICQVRQFYLICWFQGVLSVKCLALAFMHCLCDEFYKQVLTHSFSVKVEVSRIMLIEL